jgi:hypothetical protein
VSVPPPTSGAAAAAELERRAARSTRLVVGQGGKTRTRARPRPVTRGAAVGAMSAAFLQSPTMNSPKAGRGRIWLVTAMITRSRRGAWYWDELTTTAGRFLRPLGR